MTRLSSYIYYICTYVCACLVLLTGSVELFNTRKCLNQPTEPNVVVYVYNILHMYVCACLVCLDFYLQVYKWTFTLITWRLQAAHCSSGHSDRAFKEVCGGPTIFTYMHVHMCMFSLSQFLLTGLQHIAALATRTEHIAALGTLKEVCGGRFLLTDFEEETGGGPGGQETRELCSC